VSWRKPGNGGAIIIVTCLLGMCTGCCCPRPRHGVIIRGDWALEVNRIPWLKSRSPEYQGTCYPDPVCSAPCGANAEAPASFPGDAGGAVGPAGGDVACRAAGVGRGVCGVCRGCRLGGRCVEPGVAVGYHNHPRFHPVPTRPVFLPRCDACAAVDGRGYGKGAPAMDCGSPGTAPPTVVPEPEEIPTPPTRLDEGWKARGSGQADAVSGGTSWIFTPRGDEALETKTRPQLGVRARRNQVAGGQRA